MSNRGRFRCPEKAGRNVALLSRAPPRIRNLVNSPETVNSGTFDSRSLLCHSPSDQSDPNHGCHGPTLLRTNGPTSARTYKRRSARPDKSHAAASRMEPGTSRRTMNAQKWIARSMGSISQNESGYGLILGSRQFSDDELARCSERRCSSICNYGIQLDWNEGAILQPSTSDTKSSVVRSYVAYVCKIYLCVVVLSNAFCPYFSIPSDCPAKPRPRRLSPERVLIKRVTYEAAVAYTYRVNQA